MTIDTNMAQRELASSFLPFDHHAHEKAVCTSKVKFGITVLKYCRNSRPHFIRLFLHERSPHLLQWTSVTKGFIKTMLNIREISKVIRGQDGPKFRKHKNAKWEDLSVSIYYGAGQSLDLVFASEADLVLWVSGLGYLYDDIMEREQSASYREVIRITHEWIFADRDGNNTLDFQEITELMHRCNININQKALREIFDGVDIDGNGVLDFEEFLELNERMNYKTELEPAFTFYSKDNPMQGVPSRYKRIITPEMFLRFLREEQRDTVTTLAQVQHLLRSYITPSDLRVLRGRQDVMTFSGFRKFIFSPIDNHATNGNPPTQADMSHPLHHYFIFSTHNTYLTGHQLKSKSSAEQYATVLCAGGRFVEIDCWDGPRGEPVVTHGNTLCTTILFRDVIASIKTSAFLRSPYPVILTFEIHTNIQQQERMADIMLELLGQENLYIPGLHDRELPSPWQLRNKFLLRGKVPPMGSSVIEVKTAVVAGQSEGGLKTTNLRLEMSPKLTALYAINNSQFDINSDSPTAMSTVSEKKFLKLIEQHGRERIVEYLKHNMVRATPAATRIDSSNLTPTLFWAVGVQAPALNFQTHDTGMSLSLGTFMSKGGDGGGYILKPPYLRDSQIPYSRYAPELALPKIRLLVKVKSGQYFPKPAGAEHGEIIDPFVRVTLYGHPVDQKEPQETAFIQDNGYNPIWDQAFEFDIRVVELATLHLVVMDKDPMSEDFICQNSLAVSELRSGLRVVPMFDFNNRRMENTSLLVGFHFTSLS